MNAGYLVGRGIADVTGEAAGCGMLGYGKADQVTAGIHLRLRCRAFVIAEAGQADGAPGRCVLIVVAELPLMFGGVRHAVLDRLAERFGSLYTDENVMLTVTHTHCGPGGYAHHRLYNATTHGFRPRTFGAIVAGITESAAAAHEDLAPAELYLTRGELRDASSNRSPAAFARNPGQDRAAFPDEIDPQTTLLRFERGGRLAGAINWFATHGTSMTNRNRLISSDNKGYAAYHWERLVHGVDYLAGSAAASFIGAFAQTNAGDMSPNLNHRPGSGPTEDEFENTRIIGARQYEAAAALSEQPAAPLAGGVDCRLAYLDLSDVSVIADGGQHRTTKPYAGAAALAGTDEGRGLAGFRQGRNPLWDSFSRVAYRAAPRLRDGQAPKGLIVPGGLVNRLTPLVQERVPVQLIRVGPLYLVGIPGEVTIVAGLRLRRAVAAATGADLASVLVAGYSNDYIHYVTTPEEYLEQRYEGGSTLFGRWELPALEQAARGLATAIREGAPVPHGPVPPRLPVPRAARKTWFDRTLNGQSFGDQSASPQPGYRPGESVRVLFTAAHPANDLHRGGTYLHVERAIGDAAATGGNDGAAVGGDAAVGEADATPGDDRAAVGGDTSTLGDDGRTLGGDWAAVADDGDWSTKFRWQPAANGCSTVTITWTIPAGTAPGRYRIRYHGDAAGASGPPRPFTGTSTTFDVHA